MFNTSKIYLISVLLYSSIIAGFYFGEASLGGLTMIFYHMAIFQINLDQNFLIHF